MQEKEFSNPQDRHNMCNTIVLITRFPKAGESKTRLIPAIGAQKAADLQKEMTEFCFFEAFQASDRLHVHYSSATKEEVSAWLLSSLYEKLLIKNKDLKEEDFIHQAEDKVEFIEQVEGDLGQKLGASLCYTYDYLDIRHIDKKKILIVGADCPDLRESHFNKAFQMLDNKDFVFCPTLDGGYSLIAFAIQDKPLDKYLDAFNSITWSSEKVFQESIARISQNNMTFSSLETLSDVDYVEDIPAKISLIIPTFNEEKNLTKLFNSMPSAFNVEYIVADADSSDKTREIAKNFAHKVIISDKGRAKQLHNASLEAEGEILLFLHADSLLPLAWDSQIRKYMKNENIVLGYFDFALFFEKEPNTITKFKAKMLEYMTNIRASFFKLPYGDQALFVRKKDFERWNLPLYPILEDVYLVEKARKEGNIQSTKSKVHTSYRRWEKHGFLKVITINQSVLLSRALGMDLEEIKSCYWVGKNPLLQYVKNFFAKLDR